MRLRLLTGLVVLLAGCGGTSPPDSSRAAPAPPPSAPAAAGSASVTGSVRYEGAVPDLKPISMSADPGCAAKHAEPARPELLVLGPSNTLANVLVRVKSGLPARNWPAPAEPVVIDQQGCRYRPHVVGIMVGQPLHVLNSDGLLHNVHAMPSKNQTFNRAMPASVTRTETSFSQSEEPFLIKCDVHPWMNAFMAVLDHPFFAVTGADGAFALRGLPAGSYEIEAWHERLGTQPMQLTLGEGESATADFTFRR
jgi:plastocyanin